MNTDELKISLEKERDLLKAELEDVAVKDSGNPGGYVGKEPEFMQDDNNVTGVVENASHQEEFSKNQAISTDLETQLASVESALERMEAGTYGVCTECGKEIESARLDAMPSASTCTDHM